MRGPDIVQLWGLRHQLARFERRAHGFAPMRLGQIALAPMRQHAMGFGSSGFRCVTHVALLAIERLNCKPLALLASRPPIGTPRLQLGLFQLHRIQILTVQRQISLGQFRRQSAVRDARGMHHIAVL